MQQMPQMQNFQRVQQAGNPYNMQQMPTMQPVPQMQYPKVADYVQGELAATIYPVGYNQEVNLIDIDNPARLYRKSRDANGKLSPLQKFKLVPDDESKNDTPDMTGYVKSDEILDLITETVENAVQKEVEKRLSEISFKPASKEGK